MLDMISPPFSDKPAKTLARFWANVQITDGCWLWKASKRGLYGAFCYWSDHKKIQDRAHRFSYRLHWGEIPAGLFVLHRCDNPACVNPNHLFLGNPQTNVDDMMQKERHVPGGTHCGENGHWKHGSDQWCSKLDADKVREIRRRRAAGQGSNRELGLLFGVSPSTISQIVNLRAWRWVK
jgi:hypothetical protein